MDWSSAVLAGVVATVVMTALMNLGKVMGMSMDMPRMLGLIFAEPGSGAVGAIGLVIHLMMGIVLAIVYVLLFLTFGIAPGWQWGAAFGAIHGVVAGLALGMMPMLHPRMGNGQELPAPGVFGKNLGEMTPMAVILLHVVFGAVVGVVYARLVA